MLLTSSVAHRTSDRATRSTKICAPFFVFYLARRAQRRTFARIVSAPVVLIIMSTISTSLNHRFSPTFFGIFYFFHQPPLPLSYNIFANFQAMIAFFTKRKLEKMATTCYSDFIFRISIARSIMRSPICSQSKYCL